MRAEEQKNISDIFKLKVENKFRDKASWTNIGQRYYIPKLKIASLP